MSKTVTNEREIETDWSRQKATKLNERFLKGPISIRQIGAAARLPGQALGVFLAIHHQTALTRRDWVTLPKGLLDQLGVSRDAKARALQQLETTGLVRVARNKGRSARVSLALGPASNPDAGSTRGEQVIWQNGDWTITATGLAYRYHLYQITKNQLAEVRSTKGNDAVAMWPLQLAEKSWVDIELFIEAFDQALRVHQPQGWEALDLETSFGLARSIVRGRQNAT